MSLSYYRKAHVSFPGSMGKGSVGREGAVLGVAVQRGGRSQALPGSRHLRGAGEAHSGEGAEALPGPGHRRGGSSASASCLQRRGARCAPGGRQEQGSGMPRVISPLRPAGSAAARGVPVPLTRRPAARQLLLSAVTAAILPRAERPRTHPRHSQPAAAAPTQPTSSGGGRGPGRAGPAHAHGRDRERFPVRARAEGGDARRAAFPGPQ